MKYWLRYKDNKLVGYSTYRQFKDQVCVDELPEKFKKQEEEEKIQEENRKYLIQTNEIIWEYMEQALSENETVISFKEFKELCILRQKARDKLMKTLSIDKDKEVSIS